MKLQQKWATHFFLVLLGLSMSHCKARQDQAQLKDVNFAFPDVDGGTATYQVFPKFSLSKSDKPDICLHRTSGGSARAGQTGSLLSYDEYSKMIDEIGAQAGWDPKQVKAVKDAGASDAAFMNVTTTKSFFNFSKADPKVMSILERYFSRKETCPALYSNVMPLKVTGIYLDDTKQTWEGGGQFAPVSVSVRIEGKVADAGKQRDVAFPGSLNFIDKYDDHYSYVLSKSGTSLILTDRWAAKDGPAPIVAATLDAKGRISIAAPGDAASPLSVTFEDDASSLQMGFQDKIIAPRAYAEVTVANQAHIAARHDYAASLEEANAAAKRREDAAAEDTRQWRIQEFGSEEQYYNVVELSYQATMPTGDGVRDELERAVIRKNALRELDRLGRGLYFPPAAHVVDSCFVAGTLISTPSGPKPIEDLAEGDEVLSYDLAARQVEASSITRVINHVDSTLLNIKLDDDRQLSVTRSHPFFLARLGQWRRADALVEGDLLQTYDPAKSPESGTAKIVGIHTFKRAETPVFNITVDKNHDYFANGVLVHNK